MQHIMLRRWIPLRKRKRTLPPLWLTFSWTSCSPRPRRVCFFRVSAAVNPPLPAHWIFCYGFRSCLRLGLTYITLINKGWRVPRMSHYGISPVTEPTGFNWESSIPASVLLLARSPSGLFISFFPDEGAWHFALNPLCRLRREPGVCQLTKKFVPFQCLCCKTQIQAICVWAQNWVDLRRRHSPLFAQSFFSPCQVFYCLEERSGWLLNHFIKSVIFLTRR